ncbi:MAG: hypothetical protein LC721_10235, partial [Actinobacteria bacterium]|nr:hypothetical protein [Actinomycetota bacterium]
NGIWPGGIIGASTGTKTVVQTEYMTEDDLSLLIECADPQAGSPYSLVVEQDESAAFAYLCHEGAIVTHVWLYNSGPTPDAPLWKQSAAPLDRPFPNAREFCKDDPHPLMNREGQVGCVWHREGETLVAVDVMIDSIFMARLAPGSNPGWSRLALRSGPLAQVFEALPDLSHS